MRKVASFFEGLVSKPQPDYLAIIRTSEPIESYDIKELHRRIEAARKKKAAKAAKRN